MGPHYRDGLRKFGQSDCAVHGHHILLLDFWNGWVGKDEGINSLNFGPLTLTFEVGTSPRGFRLYPISDLPISDRSYLDNAVLPQIV